MKASRAVRLLAISLTAALVSTLSIGAAQAKSVKGKYEYGFGYELIANSGDFTDSSSETYGMIHAKFTYDITSVPVNDLAKFKIEVNRHGQNTPLKGYFSFNVVTVDGKEVSPAPDVTDVDNQFVYLKTANAKKITFDIAGSLDVFNTSAAQAGKIGKIHVAILHSVTSRIPDQSNPGQFVDVSTSTPTEVAHDSKTSDLSKAVLYGHKGNTLVLPANVSSIYATMNWSYTGKAPKGTKITTNEMALKIKKPGTKKFKKAKATICTEANKYCSNVSKSANKHFFGMGANEKQNGEGLSANSISGKTLKLKWKAEFIYAYQSIIITNPLQAGSTLKIMPVKVKTK